MPAGSPTDDRMLAGHTFHRRVGRQRVGRVATHPGIRLGRAGLALAAILLAVSGAALPLSLATFTDTAQSGGAWTAGTLEPPTDVAATGGASVALTWTASTSTAAAGYLVERAPALAGPYGQVGTVAPVSATDHTDSPAAGTYWYRLATYLGDWTSATTTPVSATVSPSTSTDLVPCLAGSSLADTGGNGNGYETDPDNGCASDGLLALDTNSGTAGRSASCANLANDRHRFWGYAFGLPATVTSIDGITVRADESLGNNGGVSVLCVELSWDGGASWTAPRSVTLTGTAVATYTLGSTSDTWGRTWTVGELTPTAFVIRLTDGTTQPKQTFRLDYLAVAVEYTP